MEWSFIGAASGNDEIVTQSNVAFWPMLSKNAVM